MIGEISPIQCHIHSELKKRLERQTDIFCFLPIIFQLTLDLATFGRNYFDQVCYFGFYNVNESTYKLQVVDNVDILELGVRDGESTVAFLSALSLTQNGMLWSVDINDNKALREELGDAGLSDFWTFLVDDSVLVAQNETLPEKFDLVFIDTSHKFDATLMELETWAPRVKENGFILLHATVDYFHDDLPRQKNEVVNAIETFISQPQKDVWRYYNIDIGLCLGVMQKRNKINEQ